MTCRAATCPVTLPLPISCPVQYTMGCRCRALQSTGAASCQRCQCTFVDGRVTVLSASAAGLTTTSS